MTTLDIENAEEIIDGFHNRWDMPMSTDESLLVDKYYEWKSIMASTEPRGIQSAFIQFET